jgi:hypothetical protein
MTGWHGMAGPAQYGDYSIRAKLDDIEALPKPGC